MLVTVVTCLACTERIDKHYWGECWGESSSTLTRLGRPVKAMRLG